MGGLGVINEPCTKGSTFINRTAGEPRGFGVRIISPFNEELETMAMVALVEDAFNVPFFNTILSDDRCGTCVFTTGKKVRVVRVVGA